METHKTDIFGGEYPKAIKDVGARFAVYSGTSIKEFSKDSLSGHRQTTTTYGGKIRHAFRVDPTMDLLNRLYIKGELNQEQFTMQLSNLIEASSKTRKSYQYRPKTRLQVLTQLREWLPNHTQGLFVEYRDLLFRGSGVAINLPLRLEDKFPEMSRHKSCSCHTLQLFYRYFGWIANSTTAAVQRATKDMDMKEALKDSPLEVTAALINEEIEK